MLRQGNDEVSHLGMNGLNVGTQASFLETLGGRRANRSYDNPIAQRDPQPLRQALLVRNLEQVDNLLGRRKERSVDLATDDFSTRLAQWLNILG
jgi:hypothetical protein